MDTIMKNDMELITWQIKKILKDNLVSIYLFGSLAKGDYDDKSDYDILIFTKKNVRDYWKVGGKIRYECLGKVSRPIDVLFQELDDLNYASPLFYEISLGNKILYGKKLLSKIKKAAAKVKPIIENGIRVGWHV